jgi:hypothetical protein
MDEPICARCLHYRVTAELGTGLPEEKPKPRTCLRCDRTFASWGAANRLCAKCQEAIRVASYENLRGKVKGLETWKEDR